MIPKQTIDYILSLTKLEDVIPDLQKAGQSLFTKCPICGKFDEKKKKGLMLNPKKQIAKCFSCGWATNSPIKYLQETEKLTFIQAVEKLAELKGINFESETERQKRLEYESEKKRREKKIKADKLTESFADKQLKESGLTYEDVTVEIHDEENEKITKRPAFLPGTKTQYGEVQIGGTGNDMLIYYYDLEGKPVKYKRLKSNHYEQLVRIRWQNPGLHCDKTGRPMKYQSPAGSGSHIYIPEFIRNHYKYSKKIETLFIQEGEKKAEKSCKHGIASIGIMGIQNIAGKDHVLPTEIQNIIQKCQVQNVCFLMDSDWNDISQNIKNGDDADQRPRSFFSAVKNYNEYMRTLYNIGISVEVYWGYVEGKKDKAKGIDDLLCTVLKGKEEELKKDIDFAMHDKEGNGKYVKLKKITTIQDRQLADIWNLNDADEFAKTHKEELQKIKIFRIRKTQRRFNEEGKLELVQKIQTYEKYWEEKIIKGKEGNDRKELSFNYYNCFAFLMNRGFWRIMLKNNSWEFIHIEGKIIKKVDSYAIKDYVTNFTEEIKEIDVLNMIYRGGPQYLGPEKLSNLKFQNPTIERATRDTQCLFFKDKIWKISAEGIKEQSYNEFPNYIWENNIIKAKVEAFKPLISVRRMDSELRKRVSKKFEKIPDGEFFVDTTEEGEKCNFLSFLKNTSNFTWHEEKKFERTGNEKDAPQLEEYFQNNRHLINKMTAIGYILHNYKNDSELKAVIAMDGKISEVGSSNGRTGKSIIGMAFQEIIPTVYIAAKNKKLTEDPFIFGDVNEKTKLVNLDDLRTNVDFEFFFPLISGQLKVNPKGQPSFTLDQKDTPKLFMTTNHAINGEGTSFRDRQAFMAFSDFYNDKHKPIDDFGKNFFSEWEYEQYNLFYNCMATCLQLYFESQAKGWAGKNKGIIDPPMETLEKRRLRQQVGEDMMQWAELKFLAGETRCPLDGSSLNCRESRKELQDDFFNQNPQSRKYITTTTFKKKLILFCKYKHFHFNPNKPNEDGIDYGTWKEKYPKRIFQGEADKSGGMEYFTVANNLFTEPSEF